MSGNRAIVWSALFCGWLLLAAAPACAQGIHFGGGFGLHFGGPRFDGPRFDGPRDMDAPPPHAPASPLPMRGRPGGPDEVAIPPREPLAPPPPELSDARKCFGQAETRARVMQNKLRPPFEVMRRAAALADAQALSGKLCRWADLDVYDISLLRADGRVVHVFLDASTGREVGAPHMN